jgi:hypothetical protein
VPASRITAGATTEVAMAWQEAKQWRSFQNRFMDLAHAETAVADPL